MSTTHDAVFRRVIEEGFNRGNVSAWDECFPPTFVEHQYGMADTLAGFKEAIAALRSGIPDLRLTIDELVEHGDKIWARMTARGTHGGPLFGRAATHKSFTSACWPDGSSCRPMKTSTCGTASPSKLP